jgi:integrase
VVAPDRRYHNAVAHLRGLLEACVRAPQEVRHRQDSATRRRRDGAFLSLLYASRLRRAEAVALEPADLDQVTGQLRDRQGKGRKPWPVSLPASALPALQDWLEVQGSEPGPLFSAVLKNGRLVRDPHWQLQGLSGSAAWAICKERGRTAGIQPPAPHDLRRTWTGDLLEATNQSCFQGVGRPARGGRLLPHRHARLVPGPRRRPKDRHLRRHPASSRGISMVGYLLLIGVKTVKLDTGIFFGL